MEPLGKIVWVLSPRQSDCGDKRYFGPYYDVEGARGAMCQHLYSKHNGFDKHSRPDMPISASGPRG